jgi:membrane protease YdiL (CAAX protease family)
MSGKIAITYGVKWFWVVVIISLFRALLPPSIISIEGSLPVFSASVSLAKFFPPVEQYFSQVPGLYVFMLLVFAPFIEEAAFRMLPLTLVQRKRPEIVRAVVIVICGIIFGLAHGSPLNVFIQGVGGILLGMLYLANDRSQLSSYMSCVIVHSAYNFSVLMLGG